MKATKKPPRKLFKDVHVHACKQLNYQPAGYHI